MLHRALLVLLSLVILQPVFAHEAYTYRDQELIGADGSTEQVRHLRDIPSKKFLKSDIFRVGEFDFLLLIKENKGLILLFTAVVCISALRNYFSTQKNIIRKIQRTGVQNIADIQDNDLASVCGIVKVIKPADSSDTGYFISPVGRRKCVYYRIQVHEQKSDSDGGHYRKLLFEESDEHNFEIEDKTGKLLVQFRTKLRKIHIVEHLKKTSEVFNKLDNELLEYLERNGVREKTWTGLFNRSLEITETAIEVGEQILVIGLVCSKNQGTCEFENNQSGNQRLVMCGDKEHSLFVTDDRSITEIS